MISLTIIDKKYKSATIDKKYKSATQGTMR